MVKVKKGNGSMGGGGVEKAPKFSSGSSVESCGESA